MSLFPLQSVSHCINFCFFNKFIYLNSQGMSSFQYKLMISGTFDGCYDSSDTSKTRALQTSQSGKRKNRYESPTGLLSGDVVYFMYWLNGISNIQSLERT